jgi:hypothetical protein
MNGLSEMSSKGANRIFNVHPPIGFLGSRRILSGKDHSLFGAAVIIFVGGDMRISMQSVREAADAAPPPLQFRKTGLYFIQ